MTRFDVAETDGITVVVIESHLLPPDPAIVVIPLLDGYPQIRNLNPEIRFDGRRLVLATRLMIAVRRSALRRLGNVADQGDTITRAVDFLMSGA